MEFDLLIQNGTVIDGSGGPAKRADVGINGDRIVAIGTLPDASAKTTVDATGKVVSPGFIDVHIHSEVQLAEPDNQTRYGSVLQGVTTHLTAPDGFGWAPLDPDGARQLWECDLFSHGKADLKLDWPTAESFLAIFQDTTPVNIVPQVPHCAVRYKAMGWDARPATDDELAQMRETTREWLEAGATCLCLGLDYQPSAFADTRELIELSKVAKEYDAIYTAHIRNNEIGQVAAWYETMEIGEKSGAPVHISHEHVTPTTAPLLDEADSRCDLTFESYLYPAGCTHLALTLPIWAQAGGPDGILARLQEPEPRKKMRDHLQKQLTANPARSKAVFVHTQTGRYVDQSIHDAAAAEGMDVGDFAIKILEAEHPYALMVYHHGTTPEQQQQIQYDTARHPKMMVASDGIYHGESGHPRGFGCFARVPRLSVRETGAITLEEAIWKMSGLPAKRFRIKDRGLLAEGYGADIVIFDPDEIADRATWEQPRLEPVGIDRVIVNGQTVTEAGQPTGALPGRVLKR